MLLDTSKNEHNAGERVHVINKRIDQVGTQLFRLHCILWSNSSCI